jgi:hypothetical protein
LPPFFNQPFNLQLCFFVKEPNFPTSSQPKPSTTEKSSRFPSVVQDGPLALNSAGLPLTLTHCSFPIARSQIHTINRNGRTKRFSRPWRRR